jgi:hypothetical protein
MEGSGLVGSILVLMIGGQIALWIGIAKAREAAKDAINSLRSDSMKDFVTSSDLSNALSELRLAVNELKVEVRGLRGDFHQEQLRSSARRSLSDLRT